MDRDPVFWNEQQRCQVVYVVATCLRPDTPEAMAGYAVLWGNDDGRNCSGRVNKAQTQHRAELKGLRKALQKAVSTNVRSVVFVTNSEHLIDVIDQWGETKTSDWHLIENLDILLGIGKSQSAAKEYMYWLAVAEQENQKIGVERALKLAESFINNNYRPARYRNPNQKLHNTPVKQICLDESFESCESDIPVSITPIQVKTIEPVTPIPRPPTNPPVAVVVIRVNGGSKKMPPTGYIVNWGINDRRNKEGTVRSPNYPLKAHFLALNVALNTAVDVNITRVLIKTDVLSIKEIFDKYRKKPGSGSGKTAQPYIAIVKDCVELAGMLKEVTIECPRGGKTKTDSAAAPTVKKTKLPKIVRAMSIPQLLDINLPSMSDLVKENAFPKIVYIGGVCRGRGYTNGKAFYTIFWAPYDSRNQVGPVPGIVNNIRTKMYAAKEAVKFAINDGIRNLLIRTDDQMVYDTLLQLSSPIGNSDLMKEIDELKDRLNSLKFELTPHREEFLMAENLAEEEMNISDSFQESF